MAPARDTYCLLAEGSEVNTVYGLESYLPGGGGYFIERGRVRGTSILVSVTFAHGMLSHVTGRYFGVIFLLVGLACYCLVLVLLMFVYLLH